MNSRVHLALATAIRIVFSWRFLVLTLPTILLIGLTIARYRTLQRLNQDTAAVERSQAALAASEEFLSCLKDAETGQRGYLLTGRDRLLKPYQSAVRQCQALRQEVSRNATQTDRVQLILENIKELTEKKLDGLAHSVQLYRQGQHAAAIGMATASETADTMDAIRRLSSELKGAEFELAARQAISRRNSEAALQRLIVGGGILSLATFVLCVLFFTWSLDQLKFKEEQLRTSLSEKETLLREVHHRVKNNLQVISSLLRMQERSVTDQKAREALKESQRRVLSMALIHERLYGGQRIDRINFAEYARTLVDELIRSYVNRPNHITRRFDTTAVMLDMEQAIPCGLILNELVTNALKHAYPNGHDGEILVRLEEASAENVRLTVSDRGVGLPEGFDWKKSPSMGLPIVEVLAKQVGGAFSVRSHAGSTFTVEFPKELRKAATA